MKHALVLVVCVAACQRAAVEPVAPVAIQAEGPDGLRTYRLSTTAKLRDGVPANPRVIVERAGAARLRSGNVMFDALHALALDEVREASVTSMRVDQDATSVNMSAFAHFARYTRGRGGAGGEQNTLRVDGVRIYRR